MPTFLPMADDEDVLDDKDVLDDEEDPYGMDENTLSKLERKDAVSSIGKNRVSRLPLFGSVPDTTMEKTFQLLMDKL
eukprot:scaffold140721_cov55-Attheya_sp.AAC.1